MTCLEILSAIASIATALAALGAWAYYLRDRWQKRKKVEAYLKDEKENACDEDMGRRSILNVMAHCRLTEAEVFAAVFDSNVIRTPLLTDKETGRASGIMLEHIDLKPPRKF